MTSATFHAAVLISEILLTLYAQRNHVHSSVVPAVYRGGHPRLGDQLLVRYVLDPPTNQQITKTEIPVKPVTQQRYCTCWSTGNNATVVRNSSRVASAFVSCRLPPCAQAHRRVDPGAYNS